MKQALRFLWLQNRHRSDVADVVARSGFVDKATAERWISKWERESKEAERKGLEFVRKQAEERRRREQECMNAMADFVSGKAL